MTAKIKVGVLETGIPPEELLHQHGTYPDMVNEWLSGLDAEFIRYAILDGDIPDDANECDLWVITGSRFGAYEEHPWIPPLERFIRSVRDAKKAMFGICFGHQIIAQALGGTVRKSDKGWGLGVHQYEIDQWPSELGDGPAQLAMQIYHQDQVETIPAGASTIGGSAFCENGVIWYPGFALTVQGHPEFLETYASELIESRRGVGLTDQEADRGMSKVFGTTNNPQLASIVALLPHLTKTT